MTQEQLTGGDEADLELIMSTAEALRGWEKATGRQARGKPLRETIWFYWQQPRLAKDSVRGKYPRSVPWSPAAREAHGAGEAGLVIEHTQPMKVLVRSLLDDPPSDLAALRDRLDAGLSCVVITEHESAELARAGVASTVLGDDDDPFARYRLAGLEPESFKPLAADV